MLLRPRWVAVSERQELRVHSHQKDVIDKAKKAKEEAQANKGKGKGKGKDKGKKGKGKGKGKICPFFNDGLQSQ